MSKKIENPEIGKTYILDKEFNNANEVILLEFYSERKITCKVKNPNTGAEWTTMFDRLSEKENP